tara:strand:+ start:144 stop:308 length:165 start_codon:yes stop_codon:yes gene_type:complete
MKQFILEKSNADIISHGGLSLIAQASYPLPVNIIKKLFALLLIIMSIKMLFSII